MERSQCEVVTLGESLAVFNGPGQVPIEQASHVHATFAGAESNVAIGLARLGRSVRWLSVVGDDPFGRKICKTLRGEGVDVSDVRSSATAPTAVMFKSWHGHGEPRVDYYRAGSAMSMAGPRSFPPGSWRGAKVLFLTGITPALSKQSLALVRHVLADARANGMQAWIDPNYRRKLWSEDAARRTLSELFPQIDCVLAGRTEAEMLTGETEIGRIADALRRHGPQHVVIRSGGHDAVALRDGKRTTVEAFRVPRLIDPVGAGDGFNAGYLSGWLGQRPPDECLRRGHAVAAIVCQTEGDWEGLPTEPELHAFLQRMRERTLDAPPGG